MPKAYIIRVSGYHTEGISPVLSLFPTGEELISLKET